MKKNKEEAKRTDANGIPIPDDNGKLTGSRGSDTDITKLKQSEEKLKQVSARLELATRAGGVGIWDYDIVQNTLLWDDQMFALYGIERNDFSGVYEAWRSGIHPDDMRRGDNEIQLAISGEKEFDTEFMVTWPDGSVHNIRALAVVQRDDSGKALRMVGTNWDITELRKAEKAKLDDSENRYRSIFHGSPDGILIADEQTRMILFANPMQCKMLGYTEDELKTMTIAGIHPAGTFQDTLAEFESMAQGKKTRAENIQCLRKNGEFFYADITSSLITIDGRKCIIGFFRDNTQHKQAEQEILNLNVNLELKVEERTAQLAISNAKLEQENAERLKVSTALQESLDRLSKIADRIPGVVYQYRLNPDGSSCFPYASDGIQDIYRVSREEIAHDASAVFTRLHPDDFDGIVASIQASAKNNTIWQHEYRVKFDDGTVRWLSGNALPQANEDGTILWHGFITDITERKQVDEDLEESNEKYRGLSEASYEAIFFSEKGLCIEQNMAAEIMFGYTNDEALSRYGTDWIAPECREIVMNNMLSGTEDPYEAIAQRKDGTTFPCLLRGRMMYYKGRNIRITSLTDITQQKMAQDALQFQNILHSTMISNISDVIGIMGMDGVMKYKSPNIEKYFGWKPQDLIGTDGWLTIYPDDLDRIQKEFSDLVKNDKSVKTVTYRYKCKNGSYKPIELTATNLANDPVIQGVLLNYHDITEREEAENSLRRSEAEKAAIIRAVPDLMFRIRRDGTLLDYMSTDQNMLFVPEEQFTGKTISQVLPPELAIQCMAAIEKAFHHEEMVAFEYSLTVNGQPRNFEDRIIVSSADEVLSIIRDITFRKESEAALAMQSAAFESFALAIIITDIKGIIQWANSAFTGLTGYQVDEAIGKTPGSLVKSGKQDKDFHTRFWDTLLNKEVWTGELINRRKDGSLYYEEQTITPVLDSMGNISSFIAIKIDITERKRIEHALIVAKNEAEKANQAKSEFLSRMSHELRTPMNSILGFAQLLEMGELKASHKKGVEHILNSGKHLLSLINEVLDISGIEAGRVSLSIVPVQLSSIIWETIDTVDPAARAMHVKFELIDAGHEPLFVKADHHRLRQVLINLFNNAVKYNREGGSVMIKTELQQSMALEMPFVRISVSDTGSGINPEKFEKLFMPFERIGAEKTGIEGTGLGLMVVKKLMNAMGGSVGVESVPGEGSTFWIELPYIEVQEITSEQTKYSSVTPAIISEKNRTILYIEDNASNTELVEQILVNHRPFIQLVSSKMGGQTVPLAIKYAPDLILLDLDLPDMQGFEVMKLLQAEEKSMTIPVVVVSADAMAHQIEKLMKAGAKDYLTKPLDIRVFLQVVDEWMGSAK